jgi:hypothetical protein
MLIKIQMLIINFNVFRIKLLIFYSNRTFLLKYLIY